MITIKPTKIYMRCSYAFYPVRNLSLPLHPFGRSSRHYASAPNVAQPSFWLSMIPKPLRPGYIKRQKDVKKKEWNPWTFFIVMLLLIGSNSIQMISIEKNFAAFTRKSDARIGLLEDVIKRIKNGEKLNVEELLGTGNKEREQEWQDVLKNIENDDPIWVESLQDAKHKRNSTRESDDSSSISKTKSEKIRAPPGFF